MSRKKLFSGQESVCQFELPSLKSSWFCQSTTFYRNSFYSLCLAHLKIWNISFNSNFILTVLDLTLIQKLPKCSLSSVTSNAESKSDTNQIWKQIKYKYLQVSCFSTELVVPEDCSKPFLKK